MAIMYYVLIVDRGRAPIVRSVYRGESYLGARQYLADQVGVKRGWIVKTACDCDLGAGPCEKHVQ